jgi:hypothetical protein
MLQRVVFVDPSRSVRRVGIVRCRNCKQRASAASFVQVTGTRHVVRGSGLARRIIPVTVVVAVRPAIVSRNIVAWAKVIVTR